MDLFKRNRISSDFIAAPVEPSGAELEQMARTIDREYVVDALNGLAFCCHQAGRMDLADRVLDVRNTIRPAGRTP
jgi:hypothetical protein